VRQHDSAAALPIEIGADLAAIVCSEQDCLLRRRNHAQSQGREKDAKRPHARIIRAHGTNPPAENLCYTEARKLEPPTHR